MKAMKAIKGMKAMKADKAMKRKKVVAMKKAMKKVSIFQTKLIKDDCKKVFIKKHPIRQIKPLFNIPSQKFFNHASDNYIFLHRCIY